MSIFNRDLDPTERCKVLRETARTTTRWRHKSATGSTLRRCALPELSIASRIHGPVNLEVELLGPNDEALCRHYRAWAGDEPSPISPRRRLEIEIHATILALCLERKANSRLRLDIRFSASFAAHQLDLSDELAMLTPVAQPQVARATPASGHLYAGYVREFEAGWVQARRLRLAPVRWSPLETRGEPTTYQVRGLFRELDLPGRTFTDEELRFLLERLGPNDQSGRPQPGAASA